MPAKRLGGDLESVFTYDIVAQDSPSEEEFVSHVGLANEERHDVVLNSTVALSHMGPPLERNIKGRPVHAFGSADLKAREIRQINVFIDEHISEYSADQIRGDRQYIIMPHYREPDADCSVCRFNCAGFVIEAYRYAGIELVTTDMQTLPAVSLGTLSRAYPSIIRWLQSPKYREKFGLRDDGPWPVVLAGYVMNALNRSPEDIRKEPYMPKSGDDYFFSRSGSNGS